jgi:hypothetical protein
MRIVIIIVATLSIFGCATPKKIEIKQETVVKKTEQLKEPKKIITDSCLNLLNLVKSNLKCELGSNFDRVSDGIDSSGKVMYWSWIMDSTFLLANSKCWVGLTSKELINILGKPYRTGFGEDNITNEYTYIVSNNRYNAGGGTYYEYWNFNLQYDVVVFNILRKKKVIQTDSKSHMMYKNK